LTTKIAASHSRDIHNFTRKAIIVLTILILLTFVLTTTLAEASAKPRSAAGNNISQTADSAIEAFEAALNNHDSAAALALFADGAVVSDLSNIACLPGPPPDCPGYSVLTTKTQIGGWLEQLVQFHIQIKDVGTRQVSGSNVTWALQISVDEYRRLGIAPLDANANAIVQGGKINSLTITLTRESTSKLSIAYARNRASPYAIMAGGVGLGVIFVGLVFPAAAVYYISRVKRLFATVPGLDRPWILLGAGVASLFVSLLLEALRVLGGMPAGIADFLFLASLAVCSFFVMSAMILMKRAMVDESDD
jgi:hypothetical protein